jgi:hypothetical protein
LHWRQPNSNRDVYADCDAYSYGDVHADGYRDGDSDSDCKCHGYGYGYSHGHYDAETYAYTTVDTDTEASSDASAASDSIAVTETITAGTRERNSRVPRFEDGFVAPNEQVPKAALQPMGERSRRGCRPGKACRKGLTSRCALGNKDGVSINSSNQS